ncbi:MAG: HAD-IC family P-type ATPase, partial [Myxococcales bacterium]|nr:HAD-IC family P-type ATPase [Myxococcales bacterium]
MLSSDEARRRLSEDGENVLPTDRPRHLLRLMLDVVREPMLLLLVGAALLYVVLGDAIEATVLGGWVVAMVAMNVVQERRTEQALTALRRLTSPHARVVRDGVVVTVPSAEVVRGDTLSIEEGDRVPADARLVDGSNVVADESLLTGESVPVRKVVGDGGERAPGGEDLPWLWSGTLVVGGRGRAEVLATGPRTEIGRIGSSLAEVQSSETPLQREVRGMVRWFALLGLAACLFLVGGLGLTRGDWFQALLAGIALAMSAIPEEFPVVMTIFYAFGARRMAARKVLTRRMAVVEGLGATTVLATDKTGTLTENRMTLARLVAGGVEHRVGEGPLPEAVHGVVEHGILASPTNPHDPMEVAFRRLGDSHLSGTEHLHATWTPVRDYPLSPEMLAVAHVWQAPTGADYAVAVKGAVEAIVDLCHLSEQQAAPVLAAARAMSEQGLRVLAVGRATFPHEPLPADQHAFPFTYVGLAGLHDPVRAKVPAAIAACRRAGIRVIMVTGDAPGTASAIGAEAGLGTGVDVATGAELAALDDDALRERLRTVAIVARAVPEHKLRIVRGLQALGGVVGMTGDGVNDAPALKSADIGVAMGITGTEVTKEAATMVLTDDNFSTIVTA